MRHFALNHDFSRYGLVNAVTRSAQDNPDYNRATDLERLGGIILIDGLVSNKLSRSADLHKAAEKTLPAAA